MDWSGKNRGQGGLSPLCRIGLYGTVWFLFRHRVDQSLNVSFLFFFWISTKKYAEKDTTHLQVSFDETYLFLYVRRRDEGLFRHPVVRPVTRTYADDRRRLHRTGCRRSTWHPCSKWRTRSVTTLSSGPDSTWTPGVPCPNQAWVEWSPASRFRQNKNRVTLQHKEGVELQV